MPTNLEYRAGERLRKRESRRQASEAQREKGRQSLKRGHHENWKNNMKILSGGDKMRNATGYQCKVKMSGSEKKVNENSYDISLITRVT